MAINFVQANGYSGSTSASATSAVCSYAGATTAGNFLLAYVGYTGNGVAISITDSQGNTWQPCASRLDNGGGNLATQTFYLANAPGGADTVTASFASGVQYGEFYVLEEAGVAATAPVDAAGSSLVNSAAPSVGPITTTGSNELVVGAIYGYPTVSSAGSGYTLRYSHGGAGVEDLTLASPGTISAGWNVGSQAPANLQIFSFIPAAAAAPATGRLLLVGCGS